jgi:hypothetical protein
MLLRRLFLSGLLFLFVYNFSLQAAPSVSSGRIALLLMLVLYLRRASPFLRTAGLGYLVSMVSVNICLAWALFLQFDPPYQDTIQISRLVHFQLYVLLGSVLFAIAHRGDAREFAISFSIAATVQTGFVLYGFLSVEYRIWIVNTLVQSGNTDIETDVRSPGLTSSIGAALSLIQFIGVCCLLYVSYTSRSGFVRVLTAAMAVVMLASLVVVGRTGLYLSAVVFAIYVTYSLASIRRISTIVPTVACLVVFLLIFQDSFSAMTDSSISVGDTFAWAFDWYLEGESSSANALIAMEIPRLTVETFMGTGLVGTPDGGNASGHDSGYIQNYYALGLFFVAVFYAGLLFLYVWLILKHRIGWGWFPLMVMLVVEVKEPFILKYVLPFAVLTVFLCQGSRRMKSVVASDARMNNPRTLDRAYPELDLN